MREGIETAVHKLLMNELLLFDSSYFPPSYSFLLKPISLFTLEALFYLVASEGGGVLESRIEIGLRFPL